MKQRQQQQRRQAEERPSAAGPPPSATVSSAKNNSGKLMFDGRRDNPAALLGPSSSIAKKGAASDSKTKTPRRRTFGLIRDACNTCWRKKIKCTGEKPCSRCKRAGVDCSYSTRAETGRRWRKGGNDAASPGDGEAGLESKKAKTAAAGAAQSKQKGGGTQRTLALSTSRPALSVSPATGLAGLAESRYLSCFLREFAPAYPVADDASIRDGLMHEFVGLRDSDSLGSLDGPEAKRGQALSCALFSSMAIGGLLMGCPAKAVANHVESARECVARFRGSRDRCAVSALILYAMANEFMPVPASELECRKSIDEAQAIFELLPEKDPLISAVLTYRQILRGIPQLQHVETASSVNPVNNGGSGSRKNSRNKDSGNKGNARGGAPGVGLNTGTSYLRARNVEDEAVLKRAVDERAGAHLLPTQHAPPVYVVTDALFLSIRFLGDRGDVSTRLRHLHDFAASEMNRLMEAQGGAVALIALLGTLLGVQIRLGQPDGMLTAAELTSTLVQKHPGVVRTYHRHVSDLSLAVFRLHERRDDYDRLRSVVLSMSDKFVPTFEEATTSVSDCGLGVCGMHARKLLGMKMPAPDGPEGTSTGRRHGSSGNESRGNGNGDRISASLVRTIPNAKAQKEEAVEKSPRRVELADTPPASDADAGAGSTSGTAAIPRKELADARPPPPGAAGAGAERSNRDRSSTQRVPIEMSVAAVEVSPSSSSPFGQDLKPLAGVGRVTTHAAAAAAVAAVESEAGMWQLASARSDGRGDDVAAPRPQGGTAATMGRYEDDIAGLPPERSQNQIELDSFQRDSSDTLRRGVASVAPACDVNASAVTPDGRRVCGTKFGGDVSQQDVEENRSGRKRISADGVNGGGDDDRGHSGANVTSSSDGQGWLTDGLFLTGSSEMMTAEPVQAVRQPRNNAQYGGEVEQWRYGDGRMGLVPTTNSPREPWGRDPADPGNGTHGSNDNMTWPTLPLAPPVSQSWPARPHVRQQHEQAQGQANGGQGRAFVPEAPAGVFRGQDGTWRGKRPRAERLAGELESQGARLYRASNGPLAIGSEMSAAASAAEDSQAFAVIDRKPRMRQATPTAITDAMSYNTTDGARCLSSSSSSSSSPTPTPDIDGQDLIRSHSVGNRGGSGDAVMAGNPRSVFDRASLARSFLVSSRRGSVEAPKAAGTGGAIGDLAMMGSGMSSVAVPNPVMMDVATVRPSLSMIAPSPSPLSSNTLLVQSAAAAHRLGDTSEGHLLEGWGGGPEPAGRGSDGHAPGAPGKSGDRHDSPDFTSDLGILLGVDEYSAASTVEGGQSL